MPKVLMWLEIENREKVEEEVEVPDHCFDEKGDIVEEDVIEYVEEWVRECTRWGARPL